MHEVCCLDREVTNTEDEIRLAPRDADSCIALRKNISARNEAVRHDMDFFINDSRNLHVQHSSVEDLITLANVSSGDCNAALLGDAKSDGHNHSLRLGQRLAHERAQALSSRRPLAHGGDVVATLPRGHHLGVLAGCHTRRQLQDLAPRCLRRHRHLRSHKHEQAQGRSYLELHGASERV